jgi:hypothetical protein
MTEAFDAACFELGITSAADDADRRERLATIIVELADRGVTDPTVLAADAAMAMRSAGWSVALDEAEMTSPEMEKAREGWLEIIRQISKVARELEDSPNLTAQQRSHLAGITTLLSEYEKRLAGAKTDLEVELLSKAMATVINESITGFTGELEDED